MTEAGDPAPASNSGVEPGARCAVHPDAQATFLCTRCGSYGCPLCTFGDIPDREVCRSCGALGLGDPIPWERRKELGNWSAFWETTKLASRRPTAFFRTPQTKDGLGPPVLYGIAAYTFGQLAYVVIIVLALFLSGLVVAAVSDQQEVGLFLAGYSACWIVMAVPMTLLQAPVYGLMGILFAGGLSHLTLVAMKKASVPFEQTLRAVSYSNAPYFFYFIPCVGPIMAWLWMVSVETIAIRETHRIGTDRALVAVLGYRLVLLLLAVATYVGFFLFVYAMEQR